MFDTLKQHLLSNINVIGEDNYDYNNYLELLQNFIQRHLFLPASPKTLFENANPARMIAVSKLVTTLMHLQKTRWGKKLNMWERALLPTTLFAMRADPFGFIYKYANKTVSLMEDSRSMAAGWIDKGNKLNTDFNSFLDNILAGQDTITPESIYSNVRIRNVDDLDPEDEVVMENGIHVYMRFKISTVMLIVSMEL
jgi:hypothetical protein